MKNKNYVDIFCLNIALTILNSLINIFHNENWWITNAFYCEIFLTFVDGKSQFSIQVCTERDKVAAWVAA